jgi:hypothetical protein
LIDALEAASRYPYRLSPPQICLRFLVLGGMALLAGLFISYQSADASRDALKVTSENNKVTSENNAAQLRLDQFTEATSRLDSRSTTVRIAAIGELAALAEADSNRLASVASVLNGFVSERSPWPPPKNAKYPAEMHYEDIPYTVFRSPDVDAAIKALGRGALGSSTYATLTGDLRRSDIRDGNYSEADIRNAHMEGSALNGADFRNALLYDIHLEGADLSDVKFCGADLEGQVFYDDSTIWRGALGDDRTKWPAHLDIQQAGKKANDRESCA